jgi:hypothetical protein
VLRYDDVAEVPRGTTCSAFRSARDARLNDGEEPGTPFLLGVDDSEHTTGRPTRSCAQTLEDIERW